MSLIKEYLELTKQYSNEYGELTIILMQNGAFFEVYGLKNKNNHIYGCKLDDFSRICDLNIVDKKVPGGDMTINEDQVVNAGFKTHLIEKYIKKLQENGYTIIVYEEEGEDPVKKTKIRNKTGIYSPGTSFIETEQITNNICCLWIENNKSTLKYSLKNQIYIGIGLIDIYTGNTYINEYNDEYIKNPCTFDDLERFISIYNPSETIIVSNLPTNDINDIINFINLKSKSLHIVSTFNKNILQNVNIIRANNCEKQIYQTELLSKFYKINDINSFMSIFYDNVYATQAFCFLLDFVYQHNPYLIQNISEPILENTSNKLILANHSLKQLNIIDDDNYKGKYSSVSKMLNECITPMGKRKFNHIFLNPVTNKDYLQREYNIIETLLANDNEYNTIKTLLVQIKDISKIMRQIILRKVSPKLLYHLYSSILISKTIYNFVIRNENLTEYLKHKLPDFVSLINKADEIIHYFNKVFIIDDAEGIKDIDNINKIEKSFIKNGVDNVLDTNIQTLMDSQDQLEACRFYFSSLISTYETSIKPKKTIKKKIEDSIDDAEGIKEYVNIHETEKNNFSLLATDRRCKILDEVIKNTKRVTLKYRSSFSGMETHFTLELDLEYNKQSLSKKFISNSQINTLCKNVGLIKINLIDTVLKVYQTIVKKIQDYHSHIDSITNFITYVDIVYTKAFIASKYNYCKPEIVYEDSDKSFVKVTDLRHCLIEKIQQTELYVANDITLGKNSYKDGILLYGTNAVGKTSFIRALGISVIMAQAGLFVPASTYQFSPYKYIFTRILGNDNIFKGLSTFAVEMSELRTILRLANKNSMVLGDELCSGTESISAVSIFVSGVQKLSSVSCSFIFATHLHEIINYDEITSLHNVGLNHMSVVYNRENDCLVYDRKLKDGPGNNMYGLEVCKSLNLPQDFLDNAQNIRMKYHPELSSILEHKSSHYNAKHIVGGICENCKIHVAVDVHHLIFQNEADKNGTINKKGLSFSKNIKANLMNLCEKCHNSIHKSNKKYKKTKTTNGQILEEILCV
jgi:DNA mismatch repair protein MutS